MKTVLLRSLLIALVCVQAVALLLMMDKKKTANAQCVPIASPVACNQTFTIAVVTSFNGGGYVTVNCSGGTLSSIVYTGSTDPNGDPCAQPGSCSGPG